MQNGKGRQIHYDSSHKFHMFNINQYMKVCKNDLTIVHNGLVKDCVSDDCAYLILFIRLKFASTLIFEASFA